MIKCDANLVNHNGCCENYIFSEINIIVPGSIMYYIMWLRTKYLFTFKVVSRILICVFNDWRFDKFLKK